MDENLKQTVQEARDLARAVSVAIEELDLEHESTGYVLDEVTEKLRAALLKACKLTVSLFRSEEAS